MSASENIDSKFNYEVNRDLVYYFDENQVEIIYTQPATTRKTRELVHVIDLPTSESMQIKRVLSCRLYDEPRLLIVCADSEEKNHFFWYCVISKACKALSFDITIVGEITQAKITRAPFEVNYVYKTLVSERKMCYALVLGMKDGSSVLILLNIDHLSNITISSKYLDKEDDDIGHVTSIYILPQDADDKRMGHHDPQILLGYSKGAIRVYRFRATVYSFKASRIRSPIDLSEFTEFPGYPITHLSCTRTYNSLRFTISFAQEKPENDLKFENAQSYVKLAEFNEAQRRMLKIFHPPTPSASISEVQLMPHYEDDTDLTIVFYSSITQSYTISVWYMDNKQSLTHTLEKEISENFCIEKLDSPQHTQPDLQKHLLQKPEKVVEFAFPLQAVGLKRKATIDFFKDSLEAIELQNKRERFLNKAVAVAREGGSHMPLEEDLFQDYVGMDELDMSILKSQDLQGSSEETGDPIETGHEKSLDPKDVNTTEMHDELEEFDIPLKNTDVENTLVTDVADSTQDVTELIAEIDDGNTSDIQQEFNEPVSRSVATKTQPETSQVIDDVLQHEEAKQLHKNIEDFEEIKEIQSEGSKDVTIHLKEPSQVDDEPFVVIEEPNLSKNSSVSDLASDMNSNAESTDKSNEIFEDLEKEKSMTEIPTDLDIQEEESRPTEAEIRVAHDAQEKEINTSLTTEIPMDFGIQEKEISPSLEAEIPVDRSIQEEETSQILVEDTLEDFRTQEKEPNQLLAEEIFIDFITQEKMADQPSAVDIPTDLEMQSEEINQSLATEIPLEIEEESSQPLATNSENEELRDMEEISAQIDQQEGTSIPEMTVSENDEILIDNQDTPFNDSQNDPMSLDKTESWIKVDSTDVGQDEYMEEDGYFMVIDEKDKYDENNDEEMSLLNYSDKQDEENEYAEVVENEVEENEQEYEDENVHDDGYIEELKEKEDIDSLIMEDKEENIKSRVFPQEDLPEYEESLVEKTQEDKEQSVKEDWSNFREDELQATDAPQGITLSEDEHGEEKEEHYTEEEHNHVKKNELHVADTPQSIISNEREHSIEHGEGLEKEIQENTEHQPGEKSSCVKGDNVYIADTLQDVTLNEEGEKEEKDEDENNDEKEEKEEEEEEEELEEYDEENSESLPEYDDEFFDAIEEDQNESDESVEITEDRESEIKYERRSGNDDELEDYQDEQTREDYDEYLDAEGEEMNNNENEDFASLADTPNQSQSVSVTSEVYPEYEEEDDIDYPYEEDEEDLPMDYDYDYDESDVHSNVVGEDNGSSSCSSKENVEAQNQTIELIFDSEDDELEEDASSEANILDITDSDENETSSASILITDLEINSNSTQSLKPDDKVVIQDQIPSSALAKLTALYNMDFYKWGRKKC